MMPAGAQPELQVCWDAHAPDPLPATDTWHPPMLDADINLGMDDDLDLFAVVL